MYRLSLIYCKFSLISLIKIYSNFRLQVNVIWCESDSVGDFHVRLKNIIVDSYTFIPVVHFGAALNLNEELVNEKKTNHGCQFLPDNCSC